MEERMIDLQKIDTEKENVWQGIGISEEEFNECRDKIVASNGGSSVDFIEKFGFDLDEAKEELMKSNYDPKEAILALWEKRGKTKITIKECLHTMMLIGCAVDSMALFGPRPAPVVIMWFFPPPDKKESKDWLLYT